MLDRMGAQAFPQPAMGALADQIVVELSQERRKPVGIVNLPRAAGIVRPQRVAEPDGAIGEHALEQTRFVPPAQLPDHGTGCVLDHFESLGAGHQCSNNDPTGCLVRAEHRKRIVMPRLDQR